MQEQDARVKETFDALNGYYQSHDEDGRLLRRHNQVEYHTTLHYIEKHLKPGMRVLEIGAGTGRYAHALARKGVDMTAVELIPHNIEQLMAQTLPDEKLTVHQGNAMDLAMLGDNAFDMVLMLGPMYHLYTGNDQLMALGEAVRVARHGGVLLVAYCVSDLTIYSFGFQQGNMGMLLEKGMVDPVTYKTFSTPADVFQLYRKEDIDTLNARLPVTRLAYAATDLVSSLLRDTLEGMAEDMFEQYLRYHLAVCERGDLVGMTNHSLDILRKDAAPAQPNDRERLKR